MNFHVLFSTGQWQTYPLPQHSPLISPQPPLANTSLNHPQTPKSMSNFFTPPLPPTPTMNTTIQQMPPVGISSSVVIPPSVQPPPLNVPHNPHINTLNSYGGLPNVPNPVLPSLTTHTQVSKIYFFVFKIEFKFRIKLLGNVN